ncbi:Urb1p [Sugiyamaella lignohabitans]|uniref:Urb1p n=1 Tax=Sugiyamaella lignohabitans TaxID=796027 RepID=A0A167DSR4_9ASCO|nr:Urb1p [Sugiyamaella lignohabitans]ANB13249.1 Urb1p [Sugiyamaella lignohabitans]
MAEKRKRDFSKSDPVDSGLIDELGDRLSLIAEDEKKGVSSALNVENLATFANKHSSQILQAWSYYSQTNNHAKLIFATGKLGWFLAICGQNLQTLQKQGAIVIREIVEHHLKIIYRCLFSNRPTMTNPALRILSEIAKFNNGIYTGDLFSSLDLSLKAFPKILASTADESSTTKQSSMRTALLNFYLSFIKNGSAIIRKDLISQKKIVAGWMKRITQDPDHLVISTLDVFKNQILFESAFTKSTKLSFFNDWVLSNLVKLFSRSDEVVTELSKFLELLATDSANGIRFPDNGWYPPTSKTQSKRDSSASAQNVNEDSINNRLLLSLLKSLKPWEDVWQQDLSISILRSSPELLMPYVTSGLEPISFAPRLSSFWVSYANFLSRVIQLPIPQLQSLQPPATSVVVESILPLAVCKSGSLLKCLTHEVQLVRYLGCQIMVLCLKKLMTVSTEYSRRGWDLSDVVYTISDRLPDLQAIVSCLNTKSASGEVNDLLNTVITVLLSLYGTVFPDVISTFSLPSSLTNNWQHTVDSSKLDGLKLVQVRGSLQLQISSSAVGKWWNKSQGSSYSIFTRLVQLGASDSTFTDQVCQILLGLTNPTLLFQDETLVPPIEVLIRSIMQSFENFSKDEREKIWTLIDESVARCMRSPYKYVDEFAAVRADNTEVMSPLIVTMVEQWKYVKSPEASVERWFVRFIRDCCVCGESWTAAYKFISEKAGLKEQVFLQEQSFQMWKERLKLDEPFDFILSADAKDIISRSDLQFKIHGVYELQALKFRLVHDHENERMASHLLSSIPLSLAPYVAKKLFFKELIEARSVFLVKKYFITLGLFSSQEQDMDLSEIKSYVSKNLSSATIDRLAHGIWLLDSSDVMALLDSPDVSSSFCKLCIDRLTELKQAMELGILNRLISGQLIDVALAESLAANFRAKPPSLTTDLDNLLETLFENGYYKVVSSIIQSTKYLPSFIREVAEASDDSLIEIANTVAELGNTKEPSYTRLFNSASLAALAEIKKGDSKNVHSSLSLLAHTVDILSDEQLDEIAAYFDGVSGSVTLSSAIVSLAGSLYDYKPDGLKLWLQKCIVWLTKRLSEDSIITDGLRSFLLSFGKCNHHL